MRRNPALLVIASLGAVLAAAMMGRALVATVPASPSPIEPVQLPLEAAATTTTTSTSTTTSTTTTTTVPATTTIPPTAPAATVAAAPTPVSTPAAQSTVPATTPVATTSLAVASRAIPPAEAPPVTAPPTRSDVDDGDDGGHRGNGDNEGDDRNHGGGGDRNNRDNDRNDRGHDQDRGDSDDRSDRAIARTAATIAATTTEPRPLTTSPSWRRTARLAASSIRVRVVVAFFVLLATALTVSIVVVRQVQSARIQRDAELDVVHEAEELRRIAALGSRESGAPYGRDVTALFDEFLATHAAGDDEAFYTIPLDGRQAAEGIRRSFGAPTALIENSALLDHWTGSTTVSMGNFQTTAGNIVALAVPVLGPAGDDGDSLAVADGSAGGTNGDVLGVFVVTRFTDNQFDDLDDLVGLLALAGLAVLAITTMLAWSLAGRVVAPVRQLTRTARAITHSDLSARLPVNGHGEIAELGRTFNEMVDRLDSGVHAQRQFLNDVAHDLRTPITIARGHLEVLGDDPAERDAAVTIVIDELDRMGRAVSDLLVLAKAEQPHFLRLQPVDFGDLAVDVLARVSALAPRRWVVDDAPRPGMLAGVADADRLIQAMLNLAVNAAQHSDADDEIGIGVAADAPGWVRLWVRDRGPGVDPERADGLFGRYARGGPVDAVGLHDGVGLGLAIVDAISRAHGGSAELDPTPGGGATFTIRIPLEPSLDEVTR